MKYIKALKTFRLNGHSVTKGQVLAKSEFRRDDLWQNLVADKRAKEVASLTGKDEEDGGQLSDE